MKFLVQLCLLLPDDGEQFGAAIAYNDLQSPMQHPTTQQLLSYCVILSLHPVQYSNIHCVPKKGSHQTFGSNFVKS